MLNKQNLLGSLAMVAILGTGSIQAIVTPNPASLLSTKRVLIIYGTDATTSEHGGARVALNAKFNQIRSLVGFQRDSINGSATPPTNLDNYDIIIFNYWFQSAVSQQASFQPFATAFKAWANSTNKKRGWLGMHTSGANEVNEWNWFRDSVTSMQYNLHSATPGKGTVRRTTDASILSQPIMQGMADTFAVPLDEWYDFGYGPTFSNAHTIYYLDESTMQYPAVNPMNPHPMAWYRENPVNGNRFFYTALVHNSSGVNSTAGSDFMASMMLRALEYLAGYQSTPIFINGNGVYKNHKSCLYVTNGELKIDFKESFHLEVRSLQGKLLYSAHGKGQEIYHPDAFQKPGFYVVKVAGKSEVFTQKVMVQ